MEWHAVIFQIFWIGFAFVLGTIVGSLLNVCIYRLPLEKSILWPGSHCMSCLTPLRGPSNVPIVSYLLSRGRCRHCGARYSARYMGIEFLTGAAFAGLFYAEFFQNAEGIPFFRNQGNRLLAGDISWQLIAFFLRDAVLISYLIVAAFCDIDHKSIPLSVTLPGTVVGLIFTTLLPWPWPNGPAIVAQMPRPLDQPWFIDAVLGKIPPGLTLWPVWGPLPGWLPAGSTQLGLATALAGAAAGMFFVRAVRFLFMIALDKEPLGLGDADLMMMVGAFLGWQVTVVAFFAGSVAALVINVPVELFRKGNAQEGFPFGPGLVLGTLVTWFGWRWIGPPVQAIAFSELLLGGLAVFMAAGIIAITPLVAFVLRRGEGEPAVPG